MQAEIERLFDTKPDAYTQEHQQLFAAFKAALNEGRGETPTPYLAPIGGFIELFPARSPRTQTRLAEALA